MTNIKFDFQISGIKLIKVHSFHVQFTTTKWRRQIELMDTNEWMKCRKMWFDGYRCAMQLLSLSVLVFKKLAYISNEDGNLGLAVSHFNSPSLGYAVWLELAWIRAK